MRRVLAVLSLAAVVGSAIVWVRWGVPRVERRLHDRIQSGLTERLGRPVRLDAVHLHPLFLAIALDNLRVSSSRDPGAPPIFSCRRWTLLLTPIHRAQRFPWLTLSFGRSHVISPVVRLDALPPPAGRRSSFNLFALLPAHRLTWEGGTVDFPAAGKTPSFSLTGAEGTATLSSDEVSLELNGDTPWGPASLAGRAGEPVFSRRRGPRWKAVLLLPRTDAADLARLLPLHLPGSWKGPMELRLTMQGPFRKPFIERWSAEAAFKDLSWTTDRFPMVMSGKASFSPEEARVDVTVFGGSLSVKGNLLKPLDRTGRWDLSVKADRLSLPDLRGRLPWRALSVLPWRGSADLQAVMTGPRDAPDLKMSLRAQDAGVFPFIFPRFDVDASAVGGRFRLEAGLAGGRLRVSNVPAREGGSWSSQWECHLESLSLETLARTGGWGNVQGLLGGDFALRRSSETETFLAGGVLRLERPAWGDHRLDETLISYFSWRDGDVRFHNKDDSFDLLLNRKEDGWDLTHLAYTRTDGMALQASGRVRGPDKALELQATVRQGSLRDIPFLLARYPGLEGRWQADLSARGTLADPLAEVSFSGGGFRLRPDAPLHAFQGGLRWEKETFSFNDISLDGAWSAQALRLSDGHWRLGVTASGGDAGIVREVLLSSAPVSGAVTGRLTAEGGGGSPWEGAFRLEVPELRWGDAVFRSPSARGRWTENVFTLEQFSVQGSTAPLSYEGAASRASPGDWRFRLEGPYLSRARGTLRIRGKAVTLEDVDLGDGLKGKALADFGARRLSAKISVARSSAEALSRRAGLPSLGRAGGVLDGSVLLEGPFSGPEGSADLRWSGARWRGVALSGALKARWQDGALLVDAARVQDADGGGIDLHGALPRSADAPISLSGVLKEAPFRILTDRLDGGLDGEVSVSGTPAEPAVSFSLRTGGLRAADLPPLKAFLEGRYKDRVLTVTRGEAAGGDGVWRLRPGGALRFPSDGPDAHFDVASDLRNVQAGPLIFFGGLRMSGDARMDRPFSVSVIMTAEDLWVNQRVFDGEVARATWSDGQLVFDPPAGAVQRLTGGVDARGWPQLRFGDVALWQGVDRLLFLNGEVGPGPWNFSLEGHGLQADALLSLADVDVAGDGSVDVFLSGTGSGAAPRVEAQVLGRQGSLQGLPYDRLSATVVWEKSRFQLKSLEMSRRKGYALSGQGEFESDQDPDAPPRISLKLALMDGNFSILKDLWPDCRRAKGSFSGELTVTPGQDGPVTNGRFKLEGGDIRAERYVREVSDLDVVLNLKGNRVFLEDVSGRAGKGRFVVEGDVGLDGVRVSDYNLHFRTLGKRGIPVEVPQLAVPPGPLLNRFSLLRRTLQTVSQGQPQIDLSVTGPQGGHTVSGTIVLDDVHFTYPPAKDAFKGVGRGSWLSEFWREATWDVLLKTGRDTWYQNEYVNVHVDGRVGIAGPRDALRVDGKVSADQGFITYLSQPFQVRRALFEVFTDTRPGVSDGTILAYLSGEAEKSATTLDNQGVASLDTVTMTIPRAPLGEIRPRFVSRNNPGLSSERVFQKLLGFSSQDPLQSPSPEEQDQLLRAGLVQLVGSSASPFANRLARLFGIDMISAVYEPTSPVGDPSHPDNLGIMHPAGPDAPRGATVNSWSGLLRGTGASAGVRLTDRLFGVYKFKVDQDTRDQVFLRDEVQVVGRLRGNLYFKLSSELDARSLLGQPPNRQAMLERQWRFGLPRRKPKKDPNQNPDTDKKADKTTP